MPEELLWEDPFLELHPLVHPVVVTRVVGVGHVHSLRGDEAVEGHSHAEEHFAHASTPGLALLAKSGVMSRPPKALSRRSKVAPAKPAASHLP